MAWLHTWSGLIPGWVLYFVFITGTVGYFYVEVDRWMRPEQPMIAGHWPRESREMLSRADAYLREVAPDSREWRISLPTGRYNSELRVGWLSSPDGGHGEVSNSRVFDSVTDSFAEVVARDTGGGHEFYRMHWKLRYVAQISGIWIVGVCTMMMFVTIISGIVTHKKIFRDFFTFRRGTGQRSWLDAHNIASVTALPFMLMITYSGLAFFMTVYVQAPIQALYDNEDDFRAELEIPVERFPSSPPSSSGISAMLPLSYFIEESRSHWHTDSETYFMRISEPDSHAATVQLYNAGDTDVFRYGRERLSFRGTDGKLISHENSAESLAKMTRSALFGLHEGSFANAPLRWLYFISGLLGCVMIGSGLVLWAVKRRRKQATKATPDIGFRLVEILNIGTIAGLLVGVAVFFWANRLLPGSMDSRSDWEIHCLFIAWSMMFIHAALRKPEHAWVEEFSLGAALFAFLPVLNFLTTDRHLGITLPAKDWALAGFDLTALAVGTLLAAIAIKTHSLINTAK